MIGARAPGTGPEVPAAAALDAATFEAMAAAVRDGLLRAQKTLPAWMLYDARGSELFEEITRLPEYYLTRTEHALLAARAPEIVEAAGPPLQIIELGAGSAEKTELLLQAVLDRQEGATYVPIDVSASALHGAALRLRRLERLSVRPIEARYPEELSVLRALGGVRRLVVFLGSNVGNYEPDAALALLAAVRHELAPQDALLVGADLRKARSLLVPAYDDARGVTARFNKNVLARINRDLGADFDLDRFRHVAEWNAAASRMELYLESLERQRVHVSALALEVTFARGERIHTESSHKLTTAGVERLLESAGFRPEARWLDPRRWYGLYLGRAAPARR
jgi:dimethylhistidine N-methyltransferase